MGALEFVPATGPRDTTASVDVAALVELAAEILTRRAAFGSSLAPARREQALQDILRVGTSAGGARAKAVTAWNPETDEVRSGQIKAGDGFSHWLLKFDGVAGNKDKELDDPQPLVAFSRIRRHLQLQPRRPLDRRAPDDPERQARPLRGRRLRGVRPQRRPEAGPGHSNPERGRPSGVSLARFRGRSRSAGRNDAQDRRRPSYGSSSVAGAFLDGRAIVRRPPPFSHEPALLRPQPRSWVCDVPPSGCGGVYYPGEIALVATETTQVAFSSACPDRTRSGTAARARRAARTTPPPPVPYSKRSTFIGSTLLARRAGGFPVARARIA